MAIDLEGWTEIAEDPIEEPITNRPQASILQSGIDLSGWSEMEEESNIFYLEDKDKLVAIPANLDDQQAYELIQEQEYGRKKEDFFWGVDLAVLPKAAVQLALTTSKVLPIMIEEGELSKAEGAENALVRITEEIARQEELRKRVGADDPEINNFLEFFTDIHTLRKEKFINKPFGIDFLRIEQAKLQDVAEVSPQVAQAYLNIQDAVTTIQRNHFLQPKKSDKEVSVKIPFKEKPLRFTVGDVNRFLFDASNAGSSMALSLGIAYYTKNFTIGAAILSSAQKVAMSEEAREKGLSIDDRINSSNQSAIWEFVVEYIGGRIFFKGLSGKKTLLRGTLRTMEQTGEEVVQLLGEETVAKWYNMRQTTRQELMQKIAYTMAISTVVSGPISFATTIAENKGLLGEFRDLGFNDNETNKILKGIRDGSKDEVQDVVVEVLNREADKIKNTNDPDAQAANQFLTGQTEDIDPKLLPTVPDFDGVFDAFEQGEQADKLVIKAAENEAESLKQQVKDLREAGLEEQAKSIEEGRLKLVEAFLEGSGPSQEASVVIEPTEATSTEDAINSLLSLIGSTEGPQLLGEPGDQNRIRAKSGHLKSVQDAGGPKAASNILQKFLEGKKLTIKQQAKFDAMLEEFLNFAHEHIEDQQQEQQQEEEQKPAEEKKEDSPRLKALKERKQGLEDQLSKLKQGEDSKKLKRQIAQVAKKIKSVESREKSQAKREERQQERREKIKAEVEKLPKLSTEQNIAITALEKNKNRKDAIREINLRLTDDDKQNLFGTISPTDAQIDDFIKEAEAINKELNIAAKKLAKDLNKQIERGLKEDVKGATKEARLTLEDFLENELARKKDGSFTRTTINKAVELVENMVLVGEQMITPISTRLGRINPEFKKRMREFDFRLQTSINKDAERLRPYMEGIHKLDVETRIALDLALKNGEFGVVDEINATHGLTEAFEEVQKMLDEVYDRAEAVGLDIRYLQNYWPRIVKDPLGMIEHFKGDEVLWEQISTVLQGNNVEFDQLSFEEQAYAINSLMRGFKNPKIATGQPGATKARLIEKIDAKLNKFYYDSDFSITNYIQRINEAIETNKFFGKGVKSDQFMNVNDSIGAFIVREVADGNLTPKQALEMEQILRARFNPGRMGEVIGAIKDTAYITVLGNIDNAATQIGDMFLSIYRSGYLLTAKSALKSVGTSILDTMGKDIKLVELTREDLGIKQLVAEFNLDQPRLFQNAVTTVFKLGGLSFIDNLGKETAINSILDKYRSISKKKKLPKDFIRRLNNIFGEGNTQAVITDLQEGLITEDVKFLLFNEIANAQPITLSEVPEVYLRSGNGKIFYTLKTFGIKLFDFVRTESLDRIHNGIRMQNPEEVVKGAADLMRLMIAYTLMNATADVIKDALYGRPIDLKDTLVQNILELVFFDRWSRYRQSTTGIVKSAAERILPPTSIFDNVQKDAKLHMQFSDSLVFSDRLKLSESVRNIPLVGDPYYYWFGKGRIKSVEEAERLEKRREKIKWLKSIPVEDRREYERLEADEKEAEKLKRLKKRLNKILPEKMTVESLYDTLR